MKNLFKFAVTIAAVLVLIMSSAALQTYAATHTLQFVETPAVALYSSQSTSATTMVITPVPTDLQSNNLTMASFGSSPTVTVDPGILGAEEIESFTTLTNNGNNTVTLGGITRNLQSVYPYGTAGASLITHGAGATVVFSNNPQLYNRLAAWENDGIISGAWQFLATSKPTYVSSPTFGSGDGLAFVNYATLLATAFQGAATSTEGSMGIVQLATVAQVSAGTASSTSGAPLVIKASTASSTYNGATAFQGEIPVLRSTKNIDPNFIATSSSDTYNFGGNVNIASSTIYNENVGSLNATSSITATSIKVNGANVLTSFTVSHYSLISGIQVQSNGGYATSTVALGLPAGVLTASSTVTVTGNETCSGGTSPVCTVYLKDSGGTTLASCSMNGITSNNSTGFVQMTVANQSSLSSQSGISSCNQNLVTGGTNYNIGGGVTTSSLNTANATNLVMVVQVSSGQINLNQFSIVVNP